MSELVRFRPEEILKRLVAADVQFVVIGGLAARAHGSTSNTQDLDICFARDRENLERLAAVIRDISAIRRGDPRRLTSRGSASVSRDLMTSWQ
jgi:hypothetical protein